MVSPMTEWAMHVFNKSIDEGVLRRTWKSAWSRVGLADNPDMEVAGLVAAMAAALGRTGWA